MQPYFLPYIGYFQLLAAVDRFVVYDDIKYTKKGWISGNRMLMDGRDVKFSLALKAGSDYLNVRDRELAPSFDRDKLLNRFRGAYQRAPHFDQTFPLLERIVRFEDVNLFRFLHNSIIEVSGHLRIGTVMVISSSVAIDRELKGQDRVLALCEAAGADTYINAIGGVDLYSKEVFRERRINLLFIRSRPFEYPQFGAEFVPWLSIIDVLMFNSLDKVKACITANYELI
jgi:hypothetical protein